MAKVKVNELVLRDAHQSLIATRMTLDEMLPILPTMDQEKIKAKKKRKAKNMKRRKRKKAKRVRHKKQTTGLQKFRNGNAHTPGSKWYLKSSPIPKTPPKCA